MRDFIYLDVQCAVASQSRRPGAVVGRRAPGVPMGVPREP